jgi:tRNA-Thr(GGU) m(6)t(6)A37 methyltransferase TsaA
LKANIRETQSIFKIKVNQQRLVYPFNPRYINRRKIMSENEYKISPIGQIQAGANGFALKIVPQYRAALQGLEEFHHIIVLWWSHYLDNPEQRSVLVAEKPYKNGPARLGIFATRSPLRPNPICISVTQIISVDKENGEIIIPWIDAENETPILDIKPYYPSSERVRDVLMPAWCQHWPQSLEESADFDWGAEFVNAR